MKCTDIQSLLPAFPENGLTPEQRKTVESHIRQCRACRRTLDALGVLIEKTATLPRSIEPQNDIWSGIQERIATPDDKAETAALHERDAARKKRTSHNNARDYRNLALPATHNADDIRQPVQAPPLSYRLIRRLRTPAGIITLTAVVATLLIAPVYFQQSPEVAWQVTALTGVPRIGVASDPDQATLQIDEWLETDGAARAQLTVADIGELRVEPHSRLRLLNSSDADHRIELARGALEATIWAPPRIFFIETPSATAIDLGCVYRLSVDSNGSSALHVTAGYVELVKDERRTFVPAGMMCISKPGAGPGAPFAADASSEFRNALSAFEHGFEPHALEPLLNRARREDGVTLWHLLLRCNDVGRARIFDTLAALTPPPSAVERQDIVDGDRDALYAWGAALGIPAYAHNAD